MDARALLARKKLERKKAAIAKPKINSPFAEYDSLGKLKCRICLINIKHESLWNSHVASRQHKLAIQRIKDEKNKLKASISSSNNIPVQNKKIPTSSIQKSNKKESPKQNTVLLSGYGSDSDSNNSEKDDNEVIEDEPNRKRIKTTKENNNLPPGFFDNKTSDSDDSENENENDDVPSGLPAGFFDNKNKDTTMKEEEEVEEETQNLSSLPKGFFDKTSSNNDNDTTPMETVNDNNNEEKMTDLPSNFFDQKLKPKQMLNKEKVEENEALKNEIELFDKEIQKEALNVDIIEEQEEEDFYERRDKELELEQEQYLSRMAQLKNRKQQLQENKIKNQMTIHKNTNKKEEKTIEKMDEDSDTDDSDLENELYNWRSRGL